MTENDADKKVEGIRAEFAKAMDLFKKKEFREAGDLFEKMVEEHKTSDLYLVQEVYARASVYHKICLSQLKDKNLMLPETDDEYLGDGLYFLNTGKADAALERFLYLENKNIDNPFLDYLLSLAYLKKHDIENCKKYLEKAIQKDSQYKVIAHNEPDFDALFSDEDYLNQITSLEHS